MAKNLKLNIKNTQIAEAVNLSGLKSKLAAKKKKAEAEETPPSKASAVKETKIEKEEPQQPKEEAPRIRARSKSAFAEQHAEPVTSEPVVKESQFQPESTGTSSSVVIEESVPSFQLKPETHTEIFKEDITTTKEEAPLETKQVFFKDAPFTTAQPIEEEIPLVETSTKTAIPSERLGPTGRHIKDYIKAPKAAAPQPTTAPLPKKEPLPAPQQQRAAQAEEAETAKEKLKPKGKGRAAEEISPKLEEEEKKGAKAVKFKEFRDVKPSKKPEHTRQFDARDRQGLRATEEEQWRKRRPKPQVRTIQQEEVVRPTSLKIRVPITIKDLASEMKLKASQLIAKLFLQGIVVTLNDALEDETTIQLLGHEFGCEITIDTSQEKRIQITDKSIKEELQQTPAPELHIRAPVVAFMGHVDHGKTSLIDAIRKSNRAAGEAGAITQHIGAFRCSTPVGDITVLDTPGHEAFSAMRARGADVTDIVVLVVAGDEGLRQQSIEAIQHARAANVTIVVAINKSDKPNFNPDNVYRQLAEQELLPESWGGQTITINCSAMTGEGIPQLLEMLALQAEVMELKANPHTRARGRVLESELHKGLGAVTTVLVQNGTLKHGDALVFGHHWGRVKTMRNEYGQELLEAGPSTPVEITGLSGLPEAGEEFIAVKNEKEAREIAAVRTEGARQSNFVLQQKRKMSMENLFQQAADTTGKKILNVVLRADVQGSLEALRTALLKIHSDKAELNIIFTGVGEISESDIQLAAASKAVVIGFHTQIESHAESLVKQLGIQVRLHDIIYHAIDEVKLIMAGLLDKIAQETEKGKAVVKATFKSSQTGVIAGCQVTEGSIHRNHLIRVKRGQEVVWKGTIASLRRVKEDVREVQKGLECGILLNGFSDVHEGDILESYEVTYIAQEL